MEGKNFVLDKSYWLSIRIIKLYIYLIREKKMFPLADQIVRSGTSIGANIEEAVAGSSRRDFKAKLDISHKEARETSYSLKIFRDSGIIPEDLATSLIKDGDELIRLLPPSP